MTADEPRGVRNRNPGNLRDSAANPWLGLAADNPDDDGYCIFATMEHGVRAMAHLLFVGRGYIGGGIRRTIRAIITRYAPTTDNNPTAQYISTVATLTGWDADAPITRTAANAVTLCTAMIRVEVGSSWVHTASGVTAEQIATGVSWALGAAPSGQVPPPDPPDPTPLATSAQPVLVTRMATVTETVTPSFADRGERRDLLPDPQVGQLSWITAEDILQICVATSAYGGDATWETVSGTSSAAVALADGAVTLPKLAGGDSADDGQILTAAVSGADRHIAWADPSDADLADHTVTIAKLAPAEPSTADLPRLLVADLDGPEDARTLGMLWQQLPAGAIPDDIIVARMIADGAVGTDQLARRAVNREQLADGTVDYSALAVDGTAAAGKVIGYALSADVTPIPILQWQDAPAPADGTITTVKLAAAAVTRPKIAAEAVTAAHLLGTKTAGAGIAGRVLVGAWTGVPGLEQPSMRWAQVGTAGIAARAVTGNELAAAAVGTGNIADAAVTGRKIGSGTITAAKLAATVPSEQRWLTYRLLSSDPVDVWGLDWAELPASTGGISSVTGTTPINVKTSSGAVTVSLNRIPASLLPNSRFITRQMLPSGGSTGDSLQITSGGIGWGSSSGGGVSSVTASAPINARIVGTQLRLLLNAAGVDTAWLANSAVTSAKLANSAVTSGKLANGAVRNEHLFGGSTTGAVSSGKIRTNAVQNRHIQSRSIRPTTMDAGGTLRNSRYLITGGSSSVGYTFQWTTATTAVSVWSPALSAWRHTVVPMTDHVAVVATDDGDRAADITVADDGLSVSAVVQWQPGDIEARVATRLD